MEESVRKRGIRNAWILTLLGAVYVISFALLATRTNRPGTEVRWHFGGESFVPASSVYGEGYHQPVVRSDWLEFGTRSAR